MRRLLLLAAILLIPMLVLAQLPPAAPSANSGTVVISGDPTLVALTQNVVTLYQLEGFAGSINVNTAPVATAFQDLCAGSVDIVLSPRLITSEEANACLTGLYTPVGLQVATDALLIVTSPQNNFLQDLTTDQLRAAFSSALNWNDINGGYPAAPINRYLPDQATSEFTFFGGALFGGDTSQILTATNTTFNADLNIVLQALSTDPNGIGVLPASIANRNSSLARPISIGGIAPNEQAVTSGQYPLARPLLLYSAREAFLAKPSVADFLNFYLTGVTNEVKALGLYPTSDSIRQSTLAAWLTASGIAPTPTALVPLPTLALPPTAGPSPTALVLENQPTATASPAASSSAFAGDTQTLLISARADLESLTANTLGVTRPAGWSGSLDTSNPQLALLIRLDLEILAGNTLGADTRPAGWFGAVASTQYAIARDIRHDLELLADALLESTTRPQGWVGGTPILRCDRATQTLAELLERGGVFVLSADPNAADYCAQVAQAVSVFTETSLLTMTGQPIFNQQTQTTTTSGSARIDTRFAVAFFDRGASQRVGVIPIDTRVRPVGRSTSEFSNMMLIQTDDFLLFVDYNDTTLTEDEFKDLPSAEQIPTAPFCEAEFCEGG